MKTVRSLAHATKTAAQMGAPLEVGGRVINAGGAKLSVVKPEPKAPPVAPPAPTPAPDTSTLDALSHMIVLQAEAQRQTLVDMLDRLQAPPAPPPTKMRPVSFAILKDDEGKPVGLAPKYGPGAATKPRSFEVRKGRDGFAAEIIPVY